MKICHVFVHEAIESELLKEYGEVTGYGLEIEHTLNLDNYYEIDLENNELQEQYDFGLFHPPCQKWAKATQNKNREKNLIPRARELASKYCDYWVIENVSFAPLYDEIILNGAMFDKDIKYERIFESNFEIPQPEYPNQDLYKYHINNMSKMKAANIKNWKGWYHVWTLQRNCIPRYYLEYILHYCPVFDRTTKK